MDIKSSPKELWHYGVKGMRWGIRRTPEQLGHRREQKRLRKAQRAYDKKTKKNWHKAYNKAAEYANQVIIPKLNKKWEGRYDDPGYQKEYEKEFGKAYTQEWLKMFGERPV